MCSTFCFCACQVHGKTCPRVEIQVSMVMRLHVTRPAKSDNRITSMFKPKVDLPLIYMGKRAGQSHMLWYDLQPAVKSTELLLGISGIKPQTPKKTATRLRDFKLRLWHKVRAQVYVWQHRVACGKVLPFHLTVIITSKL